MKLYIISVQSLAVVVKVEVAVLAPVPNKPTVSVDVKQHSVNRQCL